MMVFTAVKGAETSLNLHTVVHWMIKKAQC